MDGLFNAANLKSLSKLLNQGGDKHNSSSEEEQEEVCDARGSRRTGASKKQAPENPRFKVNIRRVTDDKLSVETDKDKEDSPLDNKQEEDTRWKIWDDDEIPSVDTLPDDPSLDPRGVPTYDVMYQQAVSSEDIYLQMGGKTPSTVSCEDMLLTIQLPDEQRDAVHCDLTARQVDVRSVKYRLSLPLPHPVLPHLCTATWDPDKFELKLTLRLTRDFDFINF